MKNIIRTGVLLDILTLSVNIQAQSQEGVKTEQSAVGYAKGDQFQSADFGTLTLVSERKIQGLETWKAKALKEGKERTLYVPLTFLSTCTRINNQNNK